MFTATTGDFALERISGLASGAGFIELNGLSNRDDYKNASWDARRALELSPQHADAMRLLRVRRRALVARCARSVNKSQEMSSTRGVMPFCFICKESRKKMQVFAGFFGTGATANCRYYGLMLASNRDLPRARNFLQWAIKVICCLKKESSSRKRN